MNTGTNSISEQGQFGAPGTFYFNPAMMADASDNALFAFTVSGTTTYPSAWALGLTTGGNYGNIAVLAQRNSSYGNNPNSRWGDFPTAAIDPADGSLVGVTADVALGGNWATPIGVTLP